MPFNGGLLRTQAGSGYQQRPVGLAAGRLLVLPPRNHQQGGGGGERHTYSFWRRLTSVESGVLRVNSCGVLMATAGDHRDENWQQHRRQQPRQRGSNVGGYRRH